MSQSNDGKPFVFTADLKARWLEALRSGKYTQGEGQLRSLDDKFCCLGVLCDIVDSGLWKRGNKYYFYEFHDDPRFGSIPHEWGLPRMTLEGMNDGNPNTSPASFHEIADWIEANIPTKDEVTT